MPALSHTNNNNNPCRRRVRTAFVMCAVLCCSRLMSVCCLCVSTNGQGLVLVAAQLIVSAVVQVVREGARILGLCAWVPDRRCLWMTNLTPRDEGRYKGTASSSWQPAARLPLAVLYLQQQQYIFEEFACMSLCTRTCIINGFSCLVEDCAEETGALVQSEPSSHGVIVSAMMRPGLWAHSHWQGRVRHGICALRLRLYSIQHCEESRCVSALRLLLCLCVPHVIRAGIATTLKRGQARGGALSALQHRKQEFAKRQHCDQDPYTKHAPGGDCLRPAPAAAPAQGGGADLQHQRQHPSLPGSSRANGSSSSSIWTDSFESRQAQLKAEQERIARLQKLMRKE